MRYIINIFKCFLIVFLLTFSFDMQGQDKVLGTKITDENTSVNHSETAILSLESTTRGFHMPRMNTAQRDQLALRLLADESKVKETTGLVIYNTTNDCIEYWHASTSKWRSLCGSLPPAKFDFITGCSDISPSNTISVEERQSPSWQEGMSFDPKTNFISIRVYVSQIGTYTISAESGNGYFFTAEGQFQAIGNYTVILRGRGTPIKGYNQSGAIKGDDVKFTFNGTQSAKCPNGVHFTIIPAYLNMKFKKTVFEGQGKYYKGEEATEAKGNKLDVIVDVAVIGKAKITAKNTALGLSYTGEKEFELNGPNQVVTLLPDAGSATPNANEEESYDLTFDVVGMTPDDATETINGATAKVKVEPTTVSFDKTKVTFSAEPLYQSTAINANNKVTVPVKVLAPGKSTLKLTNAEGVEFISEEKDFVRDADPNKTIPVVFTANVNGVRMPSTATSEFTLSGTGGRFAVDGDDSITFELERKPLAYTIYCDQIKTNRSTILHNKPVGDGFYITVKVNVTELGEYELKTETPIQGMYFSTNDANGNKKVFTQLDDQEVHLYPVDKTIIPQKTDDPPVVTKIINNDSNSATLCNAEVSLRIGWPELNILYIVNDYQVGSHTLKGFFESQGRFGEEGVVVNTGEVLVDDKPYINMQADYVKPEQVANRKVIADKIRSGKYNMIIAEVAVTPIFGFDNEMTEALKWYMENKKGWVVLGIQSLTGSKGKSFFKDWEDISVNLYTRPSGDFGEQQKALPRMLKQLTDKEGKVVLGDRVDRHDIITGFPYNTPRFTLMDYYTLSTDKSVLWTAYVKQIDVRNSEYLPIVTLTQSSGEQSAMAIVHKDYDIAIFTNADSGNERSLMLSRYFIDYNSKNALKIPPGVFNGIDPQTGVYMTNFFQTIVHDLMTR